MSKGEKKHGEGESLKEGNIGPRRRRKTEKERRKVFGKGKKNSPRWRRRAEKEKEEMQKFNIQFRYHLLTISLTIGKQRIILVKEIVTI